MRAIRRIIAERHDRPSLVADLACEIGAEIIDGIRKPGDDLNSVDLSNRYNTSRTPIREALMLLEKEGLVVIPPRRRPRVATIGTREVRDIYGARAALVELIVSEVALRATKEDLACLRVQLELMRGASASHDVSEYLWANVEFHELNSQLAHNRTVKRILDSLLLRALPFRRLSLSQPRAMERSCEDHMHLLRAYEDRDPRLAAAIMRSNHFAALARILPIVEAGYGVQADESQAPN